MGAAVTTIITPPLRFRFSHINPTRFFNDTCYNGLAYKTPYKVEAWRIGILGSLITGINLDWFKRARQHPLQVLKGTVEIAGAVGMVAVAAKCGLVASPLLIPFAVSFLLA